MKQLTTTILVLLLGTLTAAPVLATELDGVGLPGHSGKRMERAEHLARILDLSPQQKDDIQYIFRESRKEAAPLRNTAKATMAELRAVVDAEVLDEPKMRQLVRTQAELQADMMVARHATQARVNLILTPEQRRVRDEMRKMRMEHREKRRGTGQENTPLE